MHDLHAILYLLTNAIELFNEINKKFDSRIESDVIFINLAIRNIK